MGAAMRYDPRSPSDRADMEPDEPDAVRAERDRVSYAKALVQENGWRTCLAIETRWDLAGYAPPIVTEILNLVAEGATLEDAEARGVAYIVQELFPPLRPLPKLLIASIIVNIILGLVVVL